MQPRATPPPEPVVSTGLRNSAPPTMMCGHCNQITPTLPMLNTQKTLCYPALHHRSDNDTRPPNETDLSLIEPWQPLKTVR